MSRQTTDSAGSRLVILMLGAGLVAILATSIFYRLAQPGLTIPQFVGSVSDAAQAAPGPADSAVGSLMRKVAQNPEDKEAVLELVENLLSIGQWDSAINFGQKAATLASPEDGDPRPLYLLGLAHHNKGEHAQAAELLERTLEIKPTAAAHYGLGILYLHYLNDPARAVEQLKAGLELPGVAQSLKSAMQEELDRAESAAAPQQDAPAVPIPASRDGGNS